MFAFILRSLFFLILFCTVTGMLSFVPKNYSNDYLSGIVQKHARLDSITSPRIIFAAGSNTAFGIDSKRIEETYSTPVVNLSLHAGLGTTFILEELKSVIDSGDIVLLSLEYFLGEGSTELKKLTSDFYPEASGYYHLSKSNRLFMELESIRTNIRKKLRNLLNPRTPLRKTVYSKDSFNKYGDVISHLDKVWGKRITNSTKINYRKWDGIEKINQFSVYANKKNTSVFYLFPTLMQSEYLKMQTDIDQLKDDLHRDLDVEILNQPSNFVYPDSLYFDTVYHLNKQGRIKRTDDLIVLLNNSKEFLSSLP